MLFSVLNIVAFDVSVMQNHLRKERRPQRVRKMDPGTSNLHKLLMVLMQTTLTIGEHIQ